MTISEMLNEIFDNLKEEISADVAQSEKVNDTLLKSKINAAFREIKRARRYPRTYTEAQIEEDMIDFYSNIESLARFDYNQIGAEGQTQYSADGTSIHYIDRNKYFYGVYPIARKG